MPADCRRFHINRSHYLRTCIANGNGHRGTGLRERVWHGFRSWSATQFASCCRLRRRLLINLGSSARRQPRDASPKEHLLRKIIPQLVTFCKRRRGVCLLATGDGNGLTRVLDCCLDYFWQICSQPGCNTTSHNASSCPVSKLELNLHMDLFLWPSQWIADATRQTPWSRKEDTWQMEMGNMPERTFEICHGIVKFISRFLSSFLFHFTSKFCANLNT